MLTAFPKEEAIQKSMYCMTPLEQVLEGERSSDSTAVGEWVVVRARRWERVGNEGREEILVGHGDVLCCACGSE